MQNAYENMTPHGYDLTRFPSPPVQPSAISPNAAVRCDCRRLSTRGGRWPIPPGTAVADPNRELSEFLVSQPRRPMDSERAAALNFEGVALTG